MLTVQERREVFASQQAGQAAGLSADQIAEAAGLSVGSRLPLARSRSARFAGLSVVAGIDWGTSSPNQTPAVMAVDAKMSIGELATFKTDIEAGIHQRMSGVAKKHDEHWLQAVLRRHPRVLGLEQPVLRELPAWRPQGSNKKRGVRQDARPWAGLR